MLNNINLVKYYGINSYIHKMNPLSKLLCGILFALGTLFATTTLHLSILGIILLITLFLTKVPYQYYARMIIRFRVFFLSIFICGIFFQISISALIIILIKIIYISLYIFLVSITTPPAETSYAFEKILFPVQKIKLSPSKLASYLSLILYLIPTTIQKGNLIVKNIASKGIDLHHSSFKGKYIIIKNMAVPIITLTKRELVHMENRSALRNFDIDKVRTNYRMNSWKILDTIFLLVHGIIVIYIIVSEVLLCVI